MIKLEKVSKRYQEALDEFYDISDEEGVDIIVISMELFNKLTNGKVHPFIDRVGATAGGREVCQ